MGSVGNDGIPLLDNLDLVRFVSVNQRQAQHRGLLVDVPRGCVVSQCARVEATLFGNLLFLSSEGNAAAGLQRVLFLEGCTVKVLPLDPPLLSITTAGGKTHNFASTEGPQTEYEVEDLKEWAEQIEKHKVKSLLRRMDDMEQDHLQNQTQAESSASVVLSYERSIAELNTKIGELHSRIASMQSTISSLEQERENLQSQLSKSENDRLLVLRSRGIIPKSVPKWAEAIAGSITFAGLSAEELSAAKSSTRMRLLEDLCTQPSNSLDSGLDGTILRIWTGTWNLGERDPFSGISKDQACRQLVPLLPAGYDLYILGVQNTISDSVLEAADALLALDGCRRLSLDLAKKYYSDVTGETSQQGRLVSFGSLHGLATPRYMSLAVYVRVQHLSHIHVMSACSLSLTSGSQSTSSPAVSNTISIPATGPDSPDGAVAVCLEVYGRTVAAVNAHMDYNSCETRLQQYQVLVRRLGECLGESGFSLNDQFHHTFWLGSLNFSLVDKTGDVIPTDSVLQMLGDIRMVPSLFQTHDELSRERSRRQVFYGFREATPFPNFLPTFRKIENRPTANYTRPDWVKSTYCTSIPTSSGTNPTLGVSGGGSNQASSSTPKRTMSFFKPKTVISVCPRFSDRILYASLADLVEDLIPEPYEVGMEIHERNTGDRSPADSNFSSNFSSRSGSISQPRSDTSTAWPVNTKQTLSGVRLDHYVSVNDGPGLNTSMHSPVYCTFLMRIRRETSCTVREVTDSRLLRSMSNEDLDTHANTAAIPLSMGRLLPVGMYQVRITNVRLVWGVRESVPMRAEALFPAPYECNIGTNAVLFESETLPIAPQPNPPQPTVDPKNKKNVPIRSSPAAILPKESLWSRKGETRTGTSLHLEAYRGCRPKGLDLPTLTFTWDGAEPLEYMHLCLKVALSPEETGTLRSSNELDTTSVDPNYEPFVGQCVIGLEQLCRVATARTNTTSVTRIVTYNGLPLMCHDADVEQDEIVSLSCQLQLVMC